MRYNNILYFNVISTQICGRNLKIKCKFFPNSLKKKSNNKNKINLIFNVESTAALKLSSSVINKYLNIRKDTMYIVLICISYVCIPQQLML